MTTRWLGGAAPEKIIQLKGLSYREEYKNNALFT